MRVLLAILVFIMVTPAWAQDAAAVMTRYVQVTGGAELYKKYNGLHLFYLVTLPDKTTQSVDYFHSRDGRLLLETDTGSATVSQGVTDGVAWKYAEGKGAQILAGKQAARLLAQSKGFDEDDWRIRYTSVNLLGNQSINGAACRHLKLVRTDGSVVERFYDVKSGLLVRELSTELDEAGNEHPAVAELEQYDLFGGIRRATLIHLKSGGAVTEIQIRSGTYTVKPALEAEVPRDVVRAILAMKTKPGGLPSAIDLIDKFVAASGGKAAFEKVKSEVVKADVSFPAQKLSFPVVVYSAGEKEYSSADIPSMGKFETGDDGTTAWEKSVIIGPKLKPRVGLSPFLGADAGEVLKWSDAAVEMQTMAEEQVNGKPCYLVRLGGEGEAASTACFDTKSGLLLKTTAPDVEGPAEQVYGDYRSVDGVMVSYRLETKVAGHAAEILIREIAFNGEIPAGAFDLPADVRALKVRRDAAAGKVPVAPGAPVLKRPGKVQ